MYNAITKKNFDPVKEFNGLWYNTESGVLWVWTDKPVRIGFSKEMLLVTAEVFEVEFSHTEKRNEQQYEKVFDYDKIPIKVLAEVKTYDYKGSGITIDFVNEYGVVTPVDGRELIVPCGNVSLNGKIKLTCEPQKGMIRAKIYVISYE